MQELLDLREALPAGVEVLLGGGGAGRLGAADAIEGVLVLDDRGGLRRWRKTR